MPSYQELLKYAKRMKRKPTSAERLFRERLEAARITYEHQAIIAYYIVDFAIPEKMLIIELDGKVHDNRHHRGYDHARARLLRRYGFTIVRIKNENAGIWDLKRIQEYKSHVVGTYTDALKAAKRHQQPSFKAKPKPKRRKRKQRTRERIATPPVVSAYHSLDVLEDLKAITR